MGDFSLDEAALLAIVKEGGDKLLKKMGADIVRDARELLLNTSPATIAGGRKAGHDLLLKSISYACSNGEASGAEPGSVQPPATDGTMVVGSLLPFAAKVEFGTLKSMPRPFLIPALNASIRKLGNGGYSDGGEDVGNL